MPHVIENAVVIDCLANHKEFIPEITSLLYAQWADLFRASGTSQDQLHALLVERAVTDKLPIAMVALVDGVLAGTGSIKLAEPGTKAGLSPWLAGMFVKEAYRSSGIGASIVRALEAKAMELGITTLYLSVGAAHNFYLRQGWTALERLNSYGVKEVTLMTKKLGTAPPAAGASHGLAHQPGRVQGSPA